MYKCVHPAMSGQNVWKKSMKIVSLRNGVNTSMWDLLSFLEWRMSSAEGGREAVNSFLPRKSSLLEGKSNVVKNSPDSGGALLWVQILRLTLVGCLCFGVFRLQNGLINGPYLRRLWVAYIQQYRSDSRIMLDTSWQQLLARMRCPMMSQLLHCLCLSDIY